MTTLYGDAPMAQRAIALPLLAHAQAAMSAETSMGALLRAEASFASFAAALGEGIMERRALRTLKRVLPDLDTAAATVYAEELGDAVATATAALARVESGQQGVVNAQALVVLQACDRARLAAGVLLDACEAFGFAPNGKPLPNDAAPRAKATPRPSLEDALAFSSTGEGL